MTLDELIAALEAATGPDRELDEVIATLNAGATREVQQSGRVAYHKDGFWISIGEVKPYTSSIDAALTLVPEGWEWGVSDKHPKYAPFAFVRRWGNVRAGLIFESSRPGFNAAATPAVALCIAVLKARKAIENGNRHD